ncbi:hypothetical protein ACLMJK_001057 [Lecanora helva]
MTASRDQENRTTYLIDQMYVEKLVPLYGAAQKEPIVFIHGDAQTGTNWLNTPNGRLGWASWFLEKGYTVYIVDQPQRGRSAYMPGDGSLTAFSVEQTEFQFTDPENFDIWPQAKLHTQWPGTGRKGDPVFDAFYASQVQSQKDTAITQNSTQAAGAALLDLIGPSIVITHSQAGPIGFLIADARPSLVKALISLEPQGPPFENRVFTNSTDIIRPWGLTNIPITYSPPVSDPAMDLHRETRPPARPDLTECVLQAEPGARQLVNLAKVRTLVLTTEASYHAPYDYCTVQYLKQAGVVKLDYLDLPLFGVHGNGHLMFLEKNNIEIVTLIEKWIIKGELG